VRLTVDMPGGPDLVLRFGTQLDTQTSTATRQAN
jgi:hypothetical protein